MTGIQGKNNAYNDRSHEQHTIMPDRFSLSGYVDANWVGQNRLQDSEGTEAQSPIDFASADYTEISPDMARVMVDPSTNCTQALEVRATSATQRLGPQ